MKKMFLDNLNKIKNKINIYIEDFKIDLNRKLEEEDKKELEYLNNKLNDILTILDNYFY